MIYLTTGGNGASKTLLTLYDLRKLQLEWIAKGEHRQIYYTGFEPIKAVIEEEFGWLPHDPTKWMELPDNSVLFWDEAQEFLGTKCWTGKEPQWVSDLARYRRKRGFDIWMCTPHPSMIHTFVRRLISSPSWHRHLKRVFGMEASTQIMYDAPNLRCEEMGAGEGQPKVTRMFPKEVYGWYVSASKHTGKRKIPRAVYALAASVLLVPALGWFAMQSMWKQQEARVLAINGGKPVSPAGAPGAVVPASAQAAPAAVVKTAAQYASERVPRFVGLPYTAPVYDTVTQPTEAPYPAACVRGKPAGGKEEVCRCFTQQGTVMPTTAMVCSQIVENGFYVDWRAAAAPAASVRPVAPAAGPDLAPAAPARPPIVAKAPDPVGSSVKAAGASDDLMQRHWPGGVSVHAAQGPDSGFSLPVVSGVERADGNVFRAMRSGDWARH